MCEKGKRVRLGKEKPAQWSIVRSRRSVNPEADRNVRAGFDEFCLALLSSRSSGSARWETRQVGDATGGRRDRWETPRASFIPAQGNALGSSAQNPISAEGAIHPSSCPPPAGQPIGVSPEHTVHRNPRGISVAGADILPGIESRKLKWTTDSSKQNAENRNQQRKAAIFSWPG